MRIAVVYICQKNLVSGQKEIRANRVIGRHPTSYFFDVTSPNTSKSSKTNKGENFYTLAKYRLYQEVEVST